MANNTQNDPLGIREAYLYAERMPTSTNSGADKPKRKAMFLGPDALHDLAVTSARRRTEREAMEEALALLAQRDGQLDAMASFVEWASNEWGSPTTKERERAAEIIAAGK